jgi:diaminopimelate decarboxylase
MNFDTGISVTSANEFTVPEAVQATIFDLLKHQEEPLYIYDSQLIRTMCRRFSFPYQQCSVHFATMANVHEQFLKIIKDEGINVFVNSLLHLRRVFNAGFTGDMVVYTASAMDDIIMSEVHASGALINLDSTSQIRRWTRLFPDSPYGIRCNIGELVESKKTRGGYFIGKESRLGLFPEEITDLKGNQNIRGLHLYVGTDICSIDYFRSCYEALMGFVPLFPNLSYLDLGGGFGLHDEFGKGFDFSSYGKMLSSLMAQVNKEHLEPLQVILEPGRVIGAQAGYFAAKITDIKHADGRQLIGVNASSAQFPRPLLYPDSAVHPGALLRPIGSDPVNRVMLTSIYGCSTYSRDFLAHDILFPVASEGDIVVLGEAGSYCASLHTSFLGFPPAEEFFL